LSCWSGSVRVAGSLRVGEVSLRPVPAPEVPQATARVARAAFPKGCLAMRVRDELGVLFQDAGFAAAFPTRGGPGLAPGMLAVVSVMQFAERLTDRQAADALVFRTFWINDVMDWCSPRSWIG
jgi:hypothetical protein